jgi:imidazolonepropionase
MTGRERPRMSTRYSLPSFAIGIGSVETTVLTNIGRLFTASDIGIVDDAVIALEHDQIAWVGPRTSFPGASDAAVFDLCGALVTPGLVDAHTHPLYAEPRLAEVAARSAGAGYADIAAAGGGIGATVRATRARPNESLGELTAARLAHWLTSGATTVEVKTGYHLSREGELDAVRLLAGLDGRPELPALAVTFLAAHAVPPGYAGSSDEYAVEVAGWCRDAATAGARFCDVFCDEGYFSVDAARTVLQAGSAAGLRPRVHADELARTGGALLAAELGAASADHLLRIRALAAAGVAAVLCPATALSLGTPPPARLLADAGVTLALGSDHNPGTSGITAMSLVVGLAVVALGLSVTEALTAATAGSARSLGLEDRGVVRPGARADLVEWDADHEGAFSWAWGVPARRVWRAGQLVVG